MFSTASSTHTPTTSSSLSPSPEEQTLGVDTFFRSLELIYISHFHADYHLGLTKILVMRQALNPLPKDSVYLFGEMPLRVFVGGRGRRGRRQERGINVIPNPMRMTRTLSTRIEIGIVSQDMIELSRTHAYQTGSTRRVRRGCWNYTRVLTTYVAISILHSYITLSDICTSFECK